jgi:hypothetical protein
MLLQKNGGYLICGIEKLCLGCTPASPTISGLGTVEILVGAAVSCGDRRDLPKRCNTPGLSIQVVNIYLYRSPTPAMSVCYIVEK